METKTWISRILIESQLLPAKAIECRRTQDRTVAWHVTYTSNSSGDSANVPGPRRGCDIITVLRSLSRYTSDTIHSSYTPTQLAPRYATESNTAWLRLYIVIQVASSCPPPIQRSNWEPAIYSADSWTGGPNLPTCCESEHGASRFPRNTFSRLITIIILVTLCNGPEFPLPCQLYASIAMWVCRERYSSHFPMC